MIIHTVTFSLRHPQGSSEELAFLSAAQVLATIPGVQRFEQRRQTSPKSDFTYGFSMEFADQAAYDAYDTHPDHVAFVTDRWQNEVAAFQELDFVPFTWNPDRG